MKSSVLPLLVLLVAIVVFPGVVAATDSGPTMPWDTALSNLIDNLTGRVARLMIIAAIVVTGITWALTEHGTGARKLSQLVFGGAVALGAVSFLANLGLTAAVL